MSGKSIFWTVVFGFVGFAEAGVIGDQCDWTGSGLSDNAEVGVTPVYLRCREGSLTWMYPRGALRLMLRPPLPAAERDFRVCIRVLRRPDPPDLFHTERLNFTAAERFPARLFVERKQRLVPLYSPDDEDPRELRCFTSRHGRAALYAEADPEEGTMRRVAALRYEAKPLSRHYDPATADCRPCSDSELELAFCTSDLVTRGIIVGAEQREDLDTTQLTVQLTKLIRSTSGDLPAYNTPEDVEDNRLEASSFGGRRGRAAGGSSLRHLHAHVHVGAVCEAAGSAGGAEYVVMARRRLGRLWVECAPRLGDWARLVDARTGDGDARCVLQH